MTDRRLRLVTPVALLVLAATVAPAAQGSRQAERATTPAMPVVTAVDTPGTEASPDVWLTLEQPPYEAGETVNVVANAGTAVVRTDVVTVDRGRVAAARPTRSGTAMRLPVFNGQTAPPRAVLRVSPAGSDDSLDPGQSRFVFGADFRLDGVSAGSRVDNGDNLVQRGLYDATTQYKIQVDGRRPMCRIKGAAGIVQVASSRTVRPDVWYRVRCLRRPDSVQLTVTELDAKAAAVRSQRSGTTGSLTPAAYGVPLSVGGKLTAAGRIAPSTDQFNGVVDNVLLSIG